MIESCDCNTNSVGRKVKVIGDYRHKEIGIIDSVNLYDRLSPVRVKFESGNTFDRFYWDELTLIEE